MNFGFGFVFVPRRREPPRHWFMRQWPRTLPTTSLEQALGWDERGRQVHADRPDLDDDDDL